MVRRRADLLLVARGLAESPDGARRLIMAGRVRSGTTVLVQPATLLDEAAEIEVRPTERYVSRGGHKLEGGLRAFSIDVTGRHCLDIGASTGGFTDCLLQHGAARVTAVDVGRGQLHARLRSDPRVALRDHTNARELPDVGPFGLAAVDVSFISLRAVLPALSRRAAPGTPVIVLLKPQFEAPVVSVPRGGVIKDPHIQREVLQSFLDWASREGWRVHGQIESPLRGGDGNLEYLVYLSSPGAPC